MAPQQMGHLESVTEHSLHDTRWPHGMKTMETSLSIHILHSFSCCNFRSFSSGSSSGRNNTFLLRKSTVADDAIPFTVKVCQKVCSFVCSKQKKPISNLIGFQDLKLKKSPNQYEMRSLIEITLPRTSASAPPSWGGQFKQSWIRASRLE